MKKIFEKIGRGPVFVLASVLVLALASYAFFSAAGQPNVSPSAASTPTPTSTATRRPNPYPGPLLSVTPARVYSETVPTPYVPPTLGPLPTTFIYPNLSRTPTPRDTPPVEPTVFLPTVTSWIQFQGVKTSFSFLYPAGWSVTESSNIEPGYSPDPQVTLGIVNYDLGKTIGRGGLRPGTLKIDLQSRVSPPPQGGTPFAVGPQAFPGRLFDDDQSSRDLQRTIVIYVPAGGRQWQIIARLAPPKDIADKNVEIFFQIIRSLRYASK